MVAKATQRFRQTCIFRGDHAAFTCRNMLDRMKAEDCHVRQAAHPPAFVLSPKGMACILDHHQPMTLGKCEDRRQVRGMSGIVHRAEQPESAR